VTIEVKSFLDAQKCGWVLRAPKLPVDNWKIIINSSSSKTDTFFKKNIATQDPTIRGIMGSGSGSKLKQNF
jgi:hypothetical protein